MRLKLKWNKDLVALMMRAQMLSKPGKIYEEGEYRVEHNATADCWSVSRVGDARGVCTCHPDFCELAGIPYEGYEGMEASKVRDRKRGIINNEVG